MRRGDDVKHLPSFTSRLEDAILVTDGAERSEAKWHHRHISKASGTIGTSAKRVAPSAHQRSEVALPATWV